MQSMYELLQGTRVLEVTTYWPDAVGQYLGDLGADVIKVEEPRTGAQTRALGGRSGLVYQMIQWNRGKRSLALDLKRAEGRELFLRLARDADFVVDGLRAGALDGFGVGYGAVSAVNPAIVYVSCTGFGQTGPYRRLGAHGPGFDAWSSFLPPVFDEDGQPHEPHIASIT